MVVLLRCALVLAGAQCRPTRADVAATAGLVVGFPPAHLSEVLAHLGDGEWSCTPDCFDGYIEAVESTVRYIDNLPPETVHESPLHAPRACARPPPPAGRLRVQPIQTMDEQVNQAESQIKAQLQRRADLIPNLVETVKGFAKQETTVFIEIADARARLAGAVQAGNLQEMAAANQALNAPLGRLLAIAENYPELKSNENFRQLQDQLEGTENRISVARQDYNQAAGEYNAFIRRFPYNLTAKVFGLGTPQEYFELTNEAAAEAPKVKF